MLEPFQPYFSLVGLYRTDFVQDGLYSAFCYAMLIKALTWLKRIMIVIRTLILLMYVLVIVRMAFRTHAVLECAIVVLVCRLDHMYSCTFANYQFETDCNVPAVACLPLVYIISFC